MSAERHAIPETHGPSSLWCRREWSGTVVVTLSCRELFCVSRGKLLTRMLAPFLRSFNLPCCR